MTVTTNQIATDVQMYREEASDPFCRREERWPEVRGIFALHNQCRAQHLFNKLQNPYDHPWNGARMADFIALLALAEPTQWPRFDVALHADCVRCGIVDNDGNRLWTIDFPRRPPVLIARQTPSVATYDRPDAEFRLAELESRRLSNPVTLAGALPHISRLVVIGDSLSDSEGRMYQRSFGLLPSNDQYYEGHFTNGYVWTNFISSPDFLNKPMVNYAEGGSVSAHYGWLDKVSWLVSSMDKQMALYKDCAADDLVVLSLGSNDYMTFNKTDVSEIIENQSDNIEKLLRKGVSNILVFGVPDLSLTPFARHLPSASSQERLQMLSEEHNRRLKTRVHQLQTCYPASKVVFYDIFSEFRRIYQEAEAQGYNVEQGYSQKGYIRMMGQQHQAMNIDPDYLFNDEVHPTQEVHFVLALNVSAFILQHFSAAA